MSTEVSKQQEDQEVLGKRERKKPTFYSVPVASTSSKKVHTSVEGEGISLGDYEYFVDQLNKHKGDDDVLKALHSLMYNTPGKKLEVKKHLKVFSGFAKGANIDEIVSKVLDKKKMWTVTILKSALGLFGLHQSGDREELVKRLIEFLSKPEVVKKGSGGSKKRASTAGKKRKATSKKGGAAKKKRSATGFILFGQANREDIKKKNPEASFGEVSKLVGQAWNALSESQKKEWDEKAAKLKAENEEEQESEEEEEEENGESGDEDAEASDHENNVDKKDADDEDIFGDD